MAEPVNATTQNPVLPPAPWYSSEVQVRGVIALAFQLASILFRYVGWPWWDAHADAMTADVGQGIAIAFGIWAIIGRQNSPIQPLTLTAAGADKRADSAQINPATMEKTQ
jgi:hypothetical protein